MDVKDRAKTLTETIRRKCTVIFERYGFQIACAGAFVLPMRLIFAYFILIPLLLVRLAAYKEKILRAQSRLPEQFLLLVFAFGAISSLGRAPLTSLRSCFSLLLFSGILFMFRSAAASHARAKLLLLWLVAGQTLTAFNTFLAASLPGIFPRLLIGKISESGQLGMTIFIALGLCISQVQAHPELRHRLIRLSPLALLLTFLLSIPAISSGAEIPLPAILAAGTLAVAIPSGIFILGWKRSGWSFAASPISLCFIAIPLMAAAALSNMKRGPWAGLLVGATVLGFMFSRRIIVAVLLVAAVAIFSFEPVRDRLLQSPEHFFISGGRSEIWQIGAELVGKYPLGLGLRNSRFLQEYSTSIPPELRHFHNNLLNIAAETGWIGLGIFLWWIYSILAHAFTTDENRTLAICIGCAIISWQTAGLVEYNFGDSEVLLVALLVIGVLSSFRVHFRPGPHE